MKILVTGARGTIGSHLVHELSVSGYTVIGVDKSDGDLCIKRTIYDFIEEYKPDMVLHLAAMTGCDFGDMDPGTTIAVNTLATLNIAEACKRCGIRFVYISTSEAYGDHGDKFVKESTPDVLPHNIYGLSKRWGEDAARLYYGQDLPILRLFMPFGPGFPAGFGRTAIIKYIWNLMRDEPINVVIGAKRSWVWIVDLIRAIRMVIDDEGTGIWGIGRSDNETSMLEIAYMCCDIMNKPTSLINHVSLENNRTLIKRLPNKRLLSIGWKPTIDVYDGIKITSEIMKYYDKNGMPTQKVYEEIKKFYYA